MTNKIMKTCIDYLAEVVKLNGITIIEWHTTKSSLIYRDSNNNRHVVNLEELQ